MSAILGMYNFVVQSHRREQAIFLLFVATVELKCPLSVFFLFDKGASVLMKVVSYA